MAAAGTSRTAARTRNYVEGVKALLGRTWKRLVDAQAAAAPAGEGEPVCNESLFCKIMRSIWTERLAFVGAHACTGTANQGRSSRWSFSWQ